MKKRTEIWRIVRFILISVLVNCVLSLINWMLARHIAQSVLYLLWAALTTAGEVLLHRQFTFRTSAPWLMVVPLNYAVVFLVYWIGGELLGTPVLSGALRQCLSLISCTLQYVLQRYVVYDKACDTNQWYLRRHTTKETEGV